MARPRLSDDRRRDYRLQIRLSEDEREIIESAARHHYQPTGKWVRDVMLRLIREYMPECVEPQRNRTAPDGALRRV